MFLIALESILSIVTGDSIIRSGVLDAETTISSKNVSFSVKITATFWLFFVISIFLVLKPSIEISIVNGGVSATSSIKFPSKSVLVPTDFLEILEVTGTKGILEVEAVMVDVELTQLMAIAVSMEILGLQHHH